MKEYLPKVKYKYTEIPQHICQIMCISSNFEIGEEIDLESPSPLPKKVPQTKLFSKTVKDEVFSNSKDDESDKEEEEEINLEEFEISNEEWLRDVLDRDELEVDDTLGVTFTSCILLHWKIIWPCLMSDICHVAYILSTHPIFQQHVVKNMSLEDKAAVKRIIFKSSACPGR